MKRTTNDPIIAEVRAVRENHAAQFGYDITEIFKNLRTKQKASGRKYVSYPPRPATLTTDTESTDITRGEEE